MKVPPKTFPVVLILALVSIALGRCFREPRSMAQQTAGINIVEDPLAASGTVTDDQDEVREADVVASRNHGAT